MFDLLTLLYPSPARESGLAAYLLPIRFAGEHHLVDSTGTYWYKQVMSAHFDADGSAVMVGRGAKRARDEFEELTRSIVAIGRQERGN